MPLLNINNLPISPASKAIEIIRARLAAAQGIGGTLNQSVKTGVDAMIKDAQEQAMKDSQMPCARIVYKTTDYNAASNAGAAVQQIVPVYIFFFYYYGKNAGSVLPVHFTDAREAHLRWNFEYLKNLNVLPYNTVGISEAQHEDDAGEIFWNYPEPLTFHIEYDTPFDIFDLALTMPEGMNCCRLDFSIRVRNHATFNGDSLPPVFPTFTYPVYGPNEVLATPNGSSGPLTPRVLTSNDLPVVPQFKYQIALDDLTMVAGNAYVASDPDDAVLFALPTPANLGDTCSILGYGAGGWSVTQRVGEQILLSGSTNSTTAGTGHGVESSNSYDKVTFTFSGSSGIWLADSIELTVY